MFGSPQNGWPLNELYIRSGANAGQIMDFSGPNDLCLDHINNRYAKALVPIPNPIASIHPTDILTRNASGAYNTLAANEVVRNNLGSQGVPGSVKNLVLQNAGVTLSPWVTNVWSGGVSVVPNFESSPLGGGAATKVTQIDSTGDGLFQDIVTTPSATYNMSFYIKNINSLHSKIYLWNSTDNIFSRLDFNWNGGVPSTIGIPSNASNIKYESMLNDYWRVSFIFTTTATIANTRSIVFPEGGVIAPNSVLLDGVQIEQGSFPTPPIITAGSAVTRPGQQSIISGLTLNTGIEFCHLIDIKDPGSDFVRAIQFDDGTNGNRINVACNAGNMMLDVYSGGVQQASLNLGPWAEGLQAITGSVGAGFAQGHITGGAVIAPAAPVLFPVVNQMVDSGTGFDVLDNAYTRSKETYVKTGVLPNAASAAKMEALGAARLAALA